MSARVFTTSAKKALQWIGGTEADILAANPGEKGQNAVEAIKQFEAFAESRYPGKAVYLKIQGTRLHTSTKDPDEKKQVITVSALTKNQTSRLVSGHAAEDGTFSKHETRMGSK